MRTNTTDVRLDLLIEDLSLMVYVKCFPTNVSIFWQLIRINPAVTMPVIMTLPARRWLDRPQEAMCVYSSDMPWGQS